MRPVVEAEQLSKVYSNGVQGLRQLNVEITDGLFTVLGPNGAGKTTFLRITSTQLLPSSGTAHVLGYDVVREASKVRREVAISPQDAIAYGMMTPWDYAYYFAWLRGMDRSQARDAARHALELVVLLDQRDRICASLSGGQKKRAIIASVLASDCQVLMLDEPTSGLDPVARRQIWVALRGLVKEGRSVILTTHLMDEAELISDRLMIVNEGRLVVSGRPDEVKSLVKARAKVVIEGGEFPGLEDVVRLGDRWIIYVTQEEEALGLVAKALKAGLRATVSPVTLDDVFVKLVGGEKYEAS